MILTRMGVLGLGTMGSGIAQTALESGIEVFAVELNDELLSKGAARVKDGLERRVRSGKLSSGKSSSLLSSLSLSTDISSFRNCDIIVEAVFENAETKSSALASIGRIADCPSLMKCATDVTARVLACSRFIMHCP